MNSRFRFISGSQIVAGALFLSLAGSAHAQAPAITVTVDGKPVDFGGAVPAQVGGRTLVPLRAIFEALGAQVEFNSGVIRAKRGDTNLQLILGSPQASINGVARPLEVPPQSVFGRTLVPLRFVGEAFGAGVNFNGDTGVISISSPASSPGGGNPDSPYTVPGAGQVVNGTLVKIDTTAPATVTLSEAGTLKTYALENGALVLRQLSLATSSGATPVRQNARQIALSSLASGDPVRLTLDGTGKVTQITTSATVVAAKVQFAGNNQIVLDDERDTTITIGPNIRFIDAAGKVTNSAAGLAPGQTIGLFLSRENRAIYQVSAYAPDFTPGNVAPGGVGGAGNPDPLPPGNGLPQIGAPQIQLVTHNANTPLKAGSSLEVTVRGTRGLRGTFSLGTKIQNVALTESNTQPGVYTGTYLVKVGDDILESRVSARLTAGNGVEDFAQSADTATIDTVAPRLVGTFPANGAQIAVAQPNIAIFADDLGGSGLGNATIDLITGSAARPVTTRIPATVAPPTSINAVAPAPLSGQVGVRAVITDRAGNVLNVNFGFTAIVGGGGAITSFAHGANRNIQAGDDVPLALTAQPAGRATFDVLNRNGQTIAKDVPLVETEPGKYRATYRTPATASGQLRFVGKFTGTDGATAQLETTTRVSVTGTPTKLTLQTPTDGATVTSPLTVKGTAAPGATIDVALRAEGIQFFILEYKQDLGVQQVRADANGNWTAKLDLPTLRNVSGLKFIISATQTDAAGKASDPIVVTVTR